MEPYVVCRNCGEKTSTNFSCCRNCGYSLEKASIIQTPERKVPEWKISEWQRKNLKKDIIGGLFVIFAGIVLIFSGIIFPVSSLDMVILFIIGIFVIILGILDLFGIIEIPRVDD